MPVRLFALWKAIRYSYWFLPTLMALGSVALAFSMIRLDQAVGESLLEEWSWVYAGGPEGAREVLSTIAGSMITVAGVVFSITIVALTLASSQFGPRLLRNFIRDRGNQVVLGTFIATYIYCLLVLRTVRGLEEARFVPQLSVTLGVALALASLGVLIYFIHHVARSIQVSTIIVTVGRELERAAGARFPEAGEPGPAAEPSGPSETVRAGQSGYLDLIGLERLFELATRHDLTLRLLHRPGHFVRAGDPLLLAFPAGRVPEGAAEALRAAFSVARVRTARQDAEFVVDQLVEIAVRALSPGINDPFTAISCVDWLGAGLGRILEHDPPCPFRYEAGRLRLVVYPTAFEELLDAAFNQIRQYGRASAAVSIRLLETLAWLSGHARREADRRALHRHARMVRDGALQIFSAGPDRDRIERGYRQVRG